MWCHTARAPALLHFRPGLSQLLLRRLSSASPALVTLSYEDLAAGKDLTSDILRAYGPGGTGALAISDVPGMMKARDRLLPMSYQVAHLPEAEKAKLEHEPSMYNVGWSHGKEKMGDKPDLAKGSYYANPLYDQAGTPENIAKYPFFYPDNIWPTEALPEFEPAFKSLGAIMFETVCHLAKQVDHLTAKSVPEYQQNLLAQQIGTTKKIKGMILYYFPGEEKESSGKTGSAAKEPEDNWIAWHNDSGFFTALAPDMYFDDTTGEQVACPDPEAGLYVVTRDGGTCKVEFPPNCLVVQCGECLQIVTGGLVVATPHMVRSAKPSKPGQRIGRASFPVFIDSHPEFPLSPPPGITRDQVFHRTVNSRVPPLETRWTQDGVPFVDFLGDTFKQYYEWAMKK